MPAPLISPSTIYSGPPPPYSYPSSAASSTVGGDRGGPGTGVGSYVSPPETRRTSGDEKEPSAPQRQSLPSITEALSREQQPISISSLLSTSVPPQKVSHVAQSPTSPIVRSYLDNIPKAPSNAFLHQTPSTYRPHDASDRTVRPICSPAAATPNGDSRFPAINPFPAKSSYDSHQPAHPPRTVSSPTAYSRPGASPIQHNKPLSPIYIPRTSAPASSVPFGYNVNNTYQPAVSFSPTTPGVPSYRTPTLQHSQSWRGVGGDYERVEEIRKAISKESTPPKQAYGEHVKRHLDIYDLESSLNEVRNSCQINNAAYQFIFRSLKGVAAASSFLENSALGRIRRRDPVPYLGRYLH